MFLQTLGRVFAGLSNVYTIMLALQDVYPIVLRRYSRRTRQGRRQLSHGGGGGGSSSSSGGGSGGSRSGGGGGAIILKGFQHCFHCRIVRFIELILGQASGRRRRRR